MSTNEIFYLNALSTTITALEATMEESETLALSGVPCTYSVPINLIQDLFVYHADDNDVNDLTDADLLYKLNYVSATNGVFEMNLGTTVDGNDANVICDQNTSIYPINSDGPMSDPARYLSADYVQNLAYNMFNTILGVDLFNNEQTIRSSLQTSFVSGFETTMTNLCYLTDSSGNVGVADASGNFTATTGNISNAPAKVILEQIIKKQNSRLATLSSAPADNGLSMYYVPLSVGDTLAFNLIVESSNSTLAASPVPISDRTYLIKMVIVSATN